MSTGGEPVETMPTLTPSGSSTPSTTTSTTSSTAAAPAPTAAPVAGASIADVIAFVEAGQPADESDFHEATRDGETTQLDNSIAFITPTGKTRCATGETSYDLGRLSCLTTLVDPPPEPVAVEGNWVSGWLDFPGDELQLGSLHGDPGIFSYGDGAVLPYGSSLKFGDYRCRTDEAGVFCVNYAHRSAMRISDAGVVPFGCLKPAAPDVGGETYRC